MEIGYIKTTQPAPVAVRSPSFQAQAESRDLIKAVKALNATELFGHNYELTFVLDRDTRRPLVRIVDRETREVVQQIPPEYVLRMAVDLKRER